MGVPTLSGGLARWQMLLSEFDIEVAWNLWNHYIHFWNISTTLPVDLTILLSAWNTLIPKSCIWSFIPGVTVWLIWKFRNSVVFENGFADIPSLFFLSRFYLASWFSAKFPQSMIFIDSLIGDPSLVDFCTVIRKISPSLVVFQSRSPPSASFLKLNMDGAVNRDWCKAGIGGLVMDTRGQINGSFSEPIGLGPPIWLNCRMSEFVSFFTLCLTGV
ncbi:uncharacterized protein LOC120185788 [Hibiscus syriacus]|uniref:uncharacterized protein LOC120185788 n=1 Tax=Hibiscus syriacus TaxID=106335 RepID=UPI001920D3BD|nr:uncharacterized protein LOC120185788 [Hibiscus syriacus]